MTLTLTFQSLTILSPSEVSITFVEDHPEGDRVVSYIFHVAPFHGCLGCNGEKAFTERYRRIPGITVPLWPERMALAAIHAYRETLPSREPKTAVPDSSRRGTPPPEGIVRDGCQGV